MIRCPNCNREQPLSVVTCDCGFDLQTYGEKIKAEQQIKDTATRPYQMLPILLIALKLIGALSILGGFIYAFSLFTQDESTWWIAAAFFGGILAAVPYFASSEALTILLDVSKKQDEIKSVLERLESKIN